MTRIRRLLAGLGALGALVVLVGGVPVGLALAIGWPLPHALPNWAQLQADLSAPIPDAALIKALACVVWVGWAILAAAVLTEAAAAIRGHAARRLPVAGALQPFAGHLVAAVAFALVSLTLQPTTGAPAPLSAVLLTATHPPAATAVPAAPPAGQASSSPATHRVSGALTTTTPPDATAGRVYVVRRGDTLWGIAAAQLGDPLRWRQIYALNNGRPQPDGAVLIDPNDIWPGWTLILPADASGPPLPGSPNGVAEHPTTSRPQATVQQPVPVISPTQVMHSRPATTMHVDTPPQARSAPVYARPVPPAHHQPETERAHTSPAPMVELPSGSAVALGLAAAIGTALATARLRRRRRYQPGQARPGLTATEPLAGPTVSRLRRAHLEALDADAQARGEPPAPDGFPASTAANVDASRPGCVPAGQQDGGPLSLDLLAHPGTGLTGPGASGVARALTFGLLAQSGPRRTEVLAADSAAVLLDRGDIPGLGVVSDIDTALSHLEVELVHRARLLDAHDAHDLAELAATHPEEPLAALVLLATAPPANAQRRLATILGIGGRLGIGAVLLGEWPAGLSLVVAADGTVERATGEGTQALSGARLSTLTEAEVAELVAVLVAAGGCDQPGPAPSPEYPPTQTPTETDSGWEPEPAGLARPVEVRVLGPVRVLASGTEIETGLRSKGRELLAFLATRPNGASDEVAVEAIWPDAAPGRGLEQFHTAVGNLRKVLREATGLGEAMFVEHSAGRYRVDPALVEIDLWNFQAGLVRAQQAGDDEAERAEGLAAAAACYGGDLAGDAHHEWAESLRELFRRQVVDALTDIAEISETRGDLPGALTAAEQALAADPFAEAVYRQVMRLQARAGRPDAAARTYRLLEGRLADVDAEPELVTRQLLAELTPRRPTPTTGAPRAHRGGAPPSQASPALPVTRAGVVRSSGGAGQRSSKP